MYRVRKYVEAIRVIMPEEVSETPPDIQTLQLVMQTKSIMLDERVSPIMLS
jgi:hypothetical protein